MGEHTSGTHTVRVAGTDWPVSVRMNRRARRLILRLAPEGDHLRLTLPPGVAVAEGLAFAARQDAWLQRHLQCQPARIPFADGATIPILDRPHVIRHAPETRRGVVQTDGVLYVSGQAEHLPRRVTDFLRGEARREIRPRVAALAAELGRSPGRITIRDTRSRWGSCSGHGNLNFSWRLVLAPEAVLDYVVAHEVAHMRHMNHGAAFWRLVRDLTEEVAGPRAWLHQNGERLHRYG